MHTRESIPQSISRRILTNLRLRTAPAVRPAIPFAVTLGAALVMAQPGSANAPSAQATEPREIQILAKRYAFEPGVIEVAVGEKVRFVMLSADGPHGVEIKKFKVKKDIPRGTKPVTVEFTATEAGRFPILCSEYCGDGHDDMAGTLEVVARQP
jgi:cytochrome c oxidase subunit 2